MCRFCWGQDYIQDDLTGFDQELSGHFVDVLDRLRRIIEHSSGISTLTDAAGNFIDGFRLQLLYQGLEARIRNIRPARICFDVADMRKKLKPVHS